ncbi:GGDEF domain-containing protein [Christensenellaceae bacterium OttesenSCG-928-M15]|nr:GGDEF domain-containing protein [Christensenellaceae bacterium OttesenSCG-928-M15]
MFSYKKIRYFGFEEEQILQCKDPLIAHNLRSVVTASGISAIILALYSLFPLLLKEEAENLIYNLSTALIEVVIYVSAKQIYKSGKFTWRTSMVFVLLFFFSLNAYGFYISVLENIYGLGVTCMVFLICSQILFVLRLRWRLFINGVVVSSIIVFSFALKRYPVYIFDIVNILFSSLAAIAYSFYISRILVSNMLHARSLANESASLREISSTDELTGLNNRRSYIGTVDSFLGMRLRLKKSICALMLDVDYFKNYNDFYGHPKGDEVLRAIGKILHQAAREKGAYAARVGGEEFMILYLESRIIEAENFATEVLNKIRALHIPHAKSDVAPIVTASLGLYILTHMVDETAEALYAHADDALYEAKHRGRNRIVRYDGVTKTYSTVVPVVKSRQLTQPVTKGLGRRP